MSNGRFRFIVAVENRGGHKLQTAYPSRRAWLHVAVRDGDGMVIFESDAFDASGAIGVNDNDTAPASYEPHYDEITSSDLRACDGR